MSITGRKLMIDEMLQELYNGFFMRKNSDLQSYSVTKQAVCLRYQGSMYRVIRYTV